MISYVSAWTKGIHVKMQKSRASKVQFIFFKTDEFTTFSLYSLNHKGYRINNYWIMNGTIS